MMPTLSFELAAARAAAETRTLGSTVLAQARRHPRAVAIQDAGGALSRIRLAAVALALRSRLGLAPAADEPNIGIVLPPGRGGTLANLAVALDGRTAVNLNHTTGEAQLARMLALADIRTILTSRLYLERIGQPALPARLVFLEDVLPGLPKAGVVAEMAKVMLIPPSRLDRADPHAVATIVFSSGSTGDPKGVQHTHAQILSNLDAVMAHLELQTNRESLINPLPLFHSFGLIPGTWLGLVHGFWIAAQADPRDGTALGQLAAQTRPTVLIGTPTFVRAYLRRIEPEQLRSLRIGFVGAERCPADLREQFKARYDADLLEGYGSTEMGPVVSVNTPTEGKDGSVGRPLPGVEVFTMDPDSQAILPPGEQGLLVVRSPGRMQGYLNRPDLTENVFVHGGYNMGDIGRVDADGYLYITGRLARFAKIGGEMVPLDNVEAALQAVLDAQRPGGGGAELQRADSPASDSPVPPAQSTDYSLAVAAVGDPARGERLVVLHTGLPVAPEELVKALDGLPLLFRPKARDFYQVDAIPLLGTGKRDLAAIKRLAESVAPSEDGVLARGTAAVKALVERVTHPSSGE